MNDVLPHSEACERNKAPILAALRRWLPVRGWVLEIGSGTGQHVVHFAPRFPKLSWQPSGRDDEIGGLKLRIERETGANVLPPITLDVTGAWPDHGFDAVYSSNTAHIMSWPEVQRMIVGVGKCLRPGGVFCLYGPFHVGGASTSPSNAEFDRHLQARDPGMGLRDVEALESLAERHQMRLEAREAMPANNQLLVFLKPGD
jgi:SAM-dependent methyltransferase